MAFPPEVPKNHHPVDLSVSQKMAFPQEVPKNHHSLVQILLQMHLRVANEMEWLLVCLRRYKLCGV
jgi:hypothetical protein